MDNNILIAENGNLKLYAIDNKTGYVFDEHTNTKYETHFISSILSKGVWNIVTNKKKIVVRKGGPGSGYHGHAGRPGKVGGSSTDNLSDDELLQNFKDITKENYDANPEEFALFATDAILSMFGLTDTKVSVVSHKELNDKISDVLKGGTMSAGAVGMYTHKTNELIFSRSMIMSGNYTTFVQAVFHEIGHAYDCNIRKSKFTSSYTREDFENYAESFSARARMLARYAAGKRTKLSVGSVLNVVNSGGSLYDWLVGD